MLMFSRVTVLSSKLGRSEKVRLDTGKCQCYVVDGD